jgi:hypothetical protein
MYRRLAALAVSASAIAAVLGFSPGVNAAVRAPIRTYTEQGRIVFTGTGSDKAYYSNSSGNEKVVLSPHVAFADDWRNAYNLGGVHASFGQLDIVGDHKYVRSGNGRWTVSTLNARALGTWAEELDPYVSLAKFDALHGIRRVGTGHYRVSGTYGQVGSFLAWEYGLTANSFEGGGIKTFTLDMVLDSSGRPVKITAVGRSSTLAFAVTETFANYNKPVTISVP